MSGFLVEQGHWFLMVDIFPRFLVIFGCLLTCKSGTQGSWGGPPALGDLAGLGGIPDVSLKGYSRATLSSELRREKSWNISPCPVHMTIEHWFSTGPISNTGQPMN